MNTNKYIKTLRSRSNEIDKQLDADAIEWGYESVDELLDSGDLDVEGVASVHRDIGMRDAFDMIANEMTMLLDHIPVEEYLTVYPNRKEIVLEYLKDNEGLDKLGYYWLDNGSLIGPDGDQCDIDDLDEALLELEIDQEDVRFIEKEVRRNA